MKKINKQPVLSEQLDKLVFYGFIAIVVALPIAMSRVTFDQFDIAKIFSLRLLTLLTLAFWVGKMLTSKRPELRWSKLDFVVIGFLVLVFISTLTSIHFPTALHGKFKRYEGLLTFLNYGIIYFLALQTFTSLERLASLSKIITLTGGFVAFYGVIQYMGLDPLSWSTLPFEERRSFSTFGNPDLLAGFLVILVPIAAAEFLRAKESKDNFMIGASLFVGLMCLLTAFTRGAWIGAAIALIAFAIIGGRAILSDKKKLFVILVAFVSIFAIIAIYSASTGHDVMNLVKRLQSAVQVTEGSAGMRLEIWKAGLKMIEESPVLGLGPDTFRIGSERHETFTYVKMAHGQTVADNAHNYVIQLAAGIGIPAALIFIAFIAAVVIIAARYSRKMEGQEKLLYTGLISAVIGYFVHLLFGVSVSGSTGVFWVIIGALVASTAIVRTARVEPKGTHATSLKAAMVVLVAVSTISSYYAVTMFAADYHYARALLFSSRGDNGGAVASYERAIALYKNGRYYDGYGMFLEQLGLLQKNPDLIKRAVGVYEEATIQEPLEADHYIFLAGAQARLAKRSNDPVLNTAIQELDNAIKIRPYAFSAHLLLADILLYRGEYEKTMDVLNLVLDISPGSETGLRILAKCYEEMGREEEAKALFEELNK